MLGVLVLRMQIKLRQTSSDERYTTLVTGNKQFHTSDPCQLMLHYISFVSAIEAAFSSSNAYSSKCLRYFFLLP